MTARPGWRRDAGGPPFQGGAIGSIAYEAAHLFERLPFPPGMASPGRQMSFGIYETLVAFDLVERRAFAIGPDAASAAALRDRLRAPPPRPASLPDLHFADTRSRAAYEAEVARVIAYIRDGDIFQANLSHRFTASVPMPPDPIATYRTLRQANPAPFSALIVEEGRFLASTSPERFLRLCGQEVETRPIKGTARRSSNGREDADLALGLSRSEKDRAENIMIVDLLRNDLSRVCDARSVEVPVLCGVETYASVHHLTSVVTGRLRDGLGVVELIGATFPGGSITGAPKIRAMQIITELEKAPRGAYCGAIGWVGFDGDCDFNIAIRTLEVEGNVMSIGAGGGITLLSDPAGEYQETLVKADRLVTALSKSRHQAAGEAA
jgi:para-aminobenzoate synthetase component 1